MKVKIKSWNEIKKTLDNDRSTGSLLFTKEMRKFCGQEFDTSDAHDIGEYAGWLWHPDWLEPVKEKEKETLTIKVDPNNWEEAYKILEKALNDYKRLWTKEEIAEAIRVTDEEIIKLHHKHTSPVFYYQDKNVGVTCNFGSNGKEGIYSAKCHDGEIYNIEIGRCVAICKMTGRKIPDFIANKGR